MDQPGYEGMEKGLANPRNAASGGLTCQDPNATWRRKLHFVACKTVFRNADGAFVDSQPLVLLKKLGFTVPAYVSIEIDSIETLQSAVQEFAEQRSELPYDTDGIVIRLADESAYNAAGMTGVCPNGAVAFKFETEQAETTIRMITCETGRLGYVTPVAIFDAVQLGGANVTRCCLHNWDWMRKHGNPSLGARVIIEKCGDIIPGLASVIKAGAGEVSEPSVCSSCGGKLTYESTADGSEGKKLKCTNREHCPVQFRDTILNMLRVLEVKGIAEKALDAMISAGILKSPCDLFAMKPADLRSAGFGPGESVNIFEALSDIKADAATVLAALGIESWGKRMFQKLQSGSTFYSDSVMVSGDFKMCDLIQVPGVGPGRARILSDAFVAGERGYGRKLLYALLGHVVVDVKQKVAGALSGKSFCLSGTLPQGKKKIEADIVAQGGDVKSDVAKGLSFLVAGEGSGSKSEKARKYGIPVISAEQLYSMMQGKQV
jgi:DNA ligase (NAD+)